MNPTLDLLERRTSTRTYSPRPISAEERGAILHATFRAPTAGNLMLYSILEVNDQAIKDRLAVTCDDQPFIAKAPWVLVFLADMQKWIDLFRFSRVGGLDGVEHRAVPGLGDLLLACSDALIAAQNAVIAAEALGIGSCYIGDILEQGETHAQLLGLPQHTLPIAMLCLGYPLAERPPVPHYERHMVHEDTYRRLSADELAQVSEDLAQMHAPHGFGEGTANIGQQVYRRKFTSEYMCEMNRSVEWWLQRWSSAEE